MRKLLVVLIVTGLVAAGAVVILQQNAANAQNQRPNIRSVILSRGDLTLTVNATGTVAPVQTAKLSFSAPGLVGEVLVEEGQRVQAGQLLARQDDGAQKLVLAQAEAGLNVAQLALQQLMAPPSDKDIAVAKAAISAAQGAYTALSGSVDPNAIKVAELRYQQAQTAWNDAITHRKDIGGQVSTDTPTYQIALAQEGQASFYAEIARLQLELLRRGADLRALGAVGARIAEAKAQLEQLKAGPPQVLVDRTQLGIDQAKVAVDQAKRALADTELRAPFAGIVSVVTAKPGALSVNNLPAVVITDDSRLHVDVRVDEIDIGQLREGQAVRFTLDALPNDTLNGSVERIALTANQSATIVSYDVRVALEPTNSPVRVGMTASATIIVREMHDVLRVPNLYVRLDRQTNQAFVNLVNRDGTLTEIPVSLGLRSEDYSEVLGGLNEGDSVGIDLDAGGFDLFGNEKK